MDSRKLRAALSLTAIAFTGIFSTLHSANIAPQANVTVDSEYSTFTKDKAIDGDVTSSDSRWISDDAGPSHFFELSCSEPPEVRIDRREVVWADFVAPEEALARGLVATVRRYLLARADSTASSKEMPSRSFRR